MIGTALFLGFLCSLSPAAVERADPAPPVRLTPATVPVGLFYDGAAVTVEGTAPTGAEVAVVCAGAEGSVRLKRKGKVWGLFWMNRGEVEIRNVPALYLCAFSDRDGGREAPEGDGGGAAAAGYASLRNRVVIETAEGEGEGEGERDRIFRDFIRLKESEGLYARLEGTVRIEEDPKGGRRFHAVLPLPARAPATTYTVRAFAVGGGEVRLLGEVPLVVKKVGAAAWITAMAREKGLLYGILAVVVALLAGLLTGVLFSLGGKGAH